MNPNGPSIPSPVERTCYYYGLPSRPALVARSSTDFWVEPYGPHPCPDPKELRPVGPHDLDGVWEPTVAPAIIAYLDSQQVSWTSLDPVRIGYAHDQSPPVIIWIGVIPDSLAAEKGIEVALGCRTILTDNGIYDVHVEIRESVVTLYKKLYESVRAWSPKPTAKAIASEPFTTTLGLPICGADTDVEGTGGFFFIDSQRPGKLYLVIARHVLFPPDVTTNEHHEACFSSQAVRVLLLGDAALEERLEAIRSDIRGEEIALDLATRRSQRIEDQDDKGSDAERERAHYLREEKDAKDAIVDLNKLLRDVTRDWGSPADRIIGHVVSSPPLGFSVGVEQCTEDWAVIEIDRTRVDNTNFVANCIDLGTFIPAGEFTRWMYPHRNNLRSFKYPRDRLVKFSGTIPDRQMGSPDEKTLDHNNDPFIMVMKRGGATELTVGLLGTIRSVVRFCVEGELSHPTREIAVYARNYKSTSFSEPGDSGSAVIDGIGRVAGIITGGAGASDLSDCTYVTSIHFFIKRLQEHGYQPNIFPTAADL